MTDNILDELFHGCALAAWLDQAAEEGNWPPDSEATKYRAYRYYEEALAEMNTAKTCVVTARIIGRDHHEQSEAEACPSGTSQPASNASREGR
jgi:hypothetical protein